MRFINGNRNLSQPIESKPHPCKVMEGREPTPAYTIIRATLIDLLEQVCVTEDAVDAIMRCCEALASLARRVHKPRRDVAAHHWWWAHQLVREYYAPWTCSARDWHTVKHLLAAHLYSFSNTGLANAHAVAATQMLSSPLEHISVICTPTKSGWKKYLCGMKEALINMCPSEHCQLWDVLDQ
ncbi:ORF106 [Ranid herpesvirus 1]|uniref:ORF106 n=1 Tax=Ranid herpesvirus 1 TaxID=85655 RepID=Q14VM4_9VIRU|nr:ORF106 [Ranid herpesvirus 1]ABG25801.1 ORF106 [Ranid herpesvirus 1]